MKPATLRLAALAAVLTAPAGALTLDGGSVIFDPTAGLLEYTANFSNVNVSAGFNPTSGLTGITGLAFDFDGTAATVFDPIANVSLLSSNLPGTTIESISDEESGQIDFEFGSQVENTPTGFSFNAIVEVPNIGALLTGNLVVDVSGIVEIGTVSVGQNLTTLDVSQGTVVRPTVDGNDQVIPLPAGFWLALTGLAALGYTARRGS
ncbi:MAG: VPLPA-CTERM sorting domain-containing protein [Paracoccaceae bacterium]